MVSSGFDVHDKFYPAPLASHEDVVGNPSLFFDTLKLFHSKLGTKFTVPIIGGKELNLHVLYVEVTTRGGYDKVVVEKKWREISGKFNFSATTTSASFVLKKHYYTLLLHYERVYFFKLQGPFVSSSPAANSGSKFSREPKFAGLLEYPSKLVDEEEDGSCGWIPEATGTIDGKFECGYLVTVKLGRELLNGVLYHPKHPNFTKPTIKSCTAIVPFVDKPRRKNRRSRKRRRGRDPNHPKPNRSGYNFFFAEKHMKLKSLCPDKEREFTKMIGESWNKLTTDEKMVYQNIGLKDKERYKRELKEYKERTKAGGEQIGIDG